MASKNDMTKQPISAVEWVPRDSIEANDYNPNKQAPPEHRLLKVSILQDGWTQPIVVFDDGSGGKPVIVDGEHRWRVSGDKAISAMTGGMVPIVRIRKARVDRIMSTIRHNRARGEHAVKSMADLVKELLETGKEPDDICVLLGMEDEEVRRLSEKAGLPEVVFRGHQEFSKGWVPG
jgi:ParB-like chromosome segregation protein Spo0J